MSNREQQSHFLKALIIPAGAVILWAILTSHLSSSLFFPSPLSVWNALVSLKLALLDDANATLGRVFIGWIIGVSFGTLAGSLMARKKLADVLLNPVIEVLRPVPPVALIPFFILWFGIGQGGQIAIVALGCFMVMAVSSYTSCKAAPAVLVRAALSLGIKDYEMFRTVLLPSMLPDLVSGLRVSAALGFGLGVAAEYIGAQSGLGFLIRNAETLLQTNVILVGTVAISLESLLFDFILRHIARRYLRWTDEPPPDQLLLVSQTPSPFLHDQ